MWIANWLVQAHGLLCLEMTAEADVLRTGFKVIPGSGEAADRSIFSGQSSLDWSAIYVQCTREHALRYLPTKYERFDVVSLAKFTFCERVRLVRIIDSRVPDPTLDGAAKATIVREELATLHGVSVAPGVPLLKGLGEQRIVLVLHDDASGVEFAVPHSLLESDGFVAFERLFTFYRSPESLLRTVRCEAADGSNVALTIEERQDTTALARRFGAEDPAPPLPDLPVDTDPIALFREWLAAAETTEINDANAAALATSTPDGCPSVRMVLVKRVTDSPPGFGFFTNAESRKGQELEANPRAALCFHWKGARRQVRVEGPVTPMPPAAVDEYFKSRPLGSQVGACVSQQSRPLESRAALQAAVAKFAAEHADGAIERPAVWRGYVINPIRIEFWADGADRLHDRFLFRRSEGEASTAAGAGSSAPTSGAAGWTVTRLFP